MQAGTPKISATSPFGALSPLSIVVLVLYGSTLLVVLAGSGTFLNYHEARYALAAKEMLARRRWLVPTLLGAPRLEKPPLIY